jgi:hypothetical protein
MNAQTNSKKSQIAERYEDKFFPKMILGPETLLQY